MYAVGNYPLATGFVGAATRRARSQMPAHAHTSSHMRSDSNLMHYVRVSIVSKQCVGGFGRGRRGGDVMPHKTPGQNGVAAFFTLDVRTADVNSYYVHVKTVSCRSPAHLRTASLSPGAHAHTQKHRTLPYRFRWCQMKNDINAVNNIPGICNRTGAPTRGCVFYSDVTKCAVNAKAHTAAICTTTSTTTTGDVLLR